VGMNSLRSHDGQQDLFQVPHVFANVSPGNREDGVAEKLPRTMEGRLTTALGTSDMHAPASHAWPVAYVSRRASLAQSYDRSVLEEQEDSVEASRDRPLSLRQGDVSS
jgi:hypothetical protein